MDIEKDLTKIVKQSCITYVNINKIIQKINNSSLKLDVIFKSGDKFCNCLISTLNKHKDDVDCSYAGVDWHERIFSFKTYDISIQESWIEDNTLTLYIHK